jgi:HK97 family phage major capsid protein
VERIRKLKAERSKLLTQAKAFATIATKEDRPLTDEERSAIDGLNAQIEKIDEEIKTLEKIVDLERSAPAVRTVDVVDPEGTQASQTPNVTVHDNTRDDPYRGFPDVDSGGLGVFLHAVIQAGRQNTLTPVINGREELRLSPLKAAAGSDEQHGASQQYGGVTVPVGFSARLLMLEMEDDPTAGVTTLPMAVPSLQIPARVDKNHSSSVAGGLTVAWRPETVSISSSRVTMEQIMLTANTLGGVAYVSEELLNDSAISFAALLEAGFRDAVTDAIIRARLSGTGAGEPLGVLNSPCLASVTGNGTTGTITGPNITAMRARVWRYSRAVWLANHDCYEQIAGAHIAGTNSDSFLFNPARGVDVPDTLLGRPIIFTEYAQSLSTIGDILCCVWSEYLVGNLQGIQTAESMHVRFENNERAFRFTMRQAGAPWWRSALTPVNSSSTLSPFVGLATRTT